MCKCHFLNKKTGKQERTLGEFLLNTVNIGDEFRLPYETKKRKVVEVNFNSREVFAPPIDNYTGFEEKGENVYHFTTKAIFGEK